MRSPGTGGAGWVGGSSLLQGCAGVRRVRSAERVEMYPRRPEPRVRARGATAGGVALVYLLPTQRVRVPLWGRFCSPRLSASAPAPWVVPGRRRLVAAPAWTLIPDPQMSDTAAPAPTKHRCSRSPRSPARPRPPGSGIFPASPPSSLPLSLPSSHPLACACGAAPSRLFPACVQTCGSLRSLPASPWALRHPLLQAKG